MRDELEQPVITKLSQEFVLISNGTGAATPTPEMRLKQLKA